MSFFNNDLTPAIGDDFASFQFLGAATEDQNNCANNSASAQINNSDFTFGSFAETLNTSLSSFTNMFSNTTNSLIQGINNFTNSNQNNNHNNNNNIVNNNNNFVDQQQQQQQQQYYQDPSSQLYIAPIPQQQIEIDNNNIILDLNNFTNQINNNIVAMGQQQQQQQLVQDLQQLLACQAQPDIQLQIYQPMTTTMSDCSSPESFSPISQVPSSPSNRGERTTNPASFGSVSVPSPSSYSTTSDNVDEDLGDYSGADSSEEDLDDDSDDDKAQQRPVKKRKNSFDPAHDYGHLLPKNILLNISSKQFVVYRQKFYPSQKISKEVSNILKNQERKIKNRESAQKSRAKKTRFVEELEDQLKEANGRINKLEEENKRLKYELTHKSRDNNCASSVVPFSAFDHPLSIGPVMSGGGQRLACFFVFLLFISSIIISNNPFAHLTFNNNANSNTNIHRTPLSQAINFGSLGMGSRDIMGFQPPTAPDFENLPMANYNDSKGKLSITITPNSANQLLKNLALSHGSNQNKIQELDESITSTTTTTTTTMSSLNTNPSNVHQRTTNADICDISELPAVNNSSVRISYRSQKPVDHRPDQPKQQQKQQSTDNKQLATQDSRTKSITLQYGDVQFDLNLVFPTQFFKNGSTDITNLLQSSLDSPLEITASVLGMSQQHQNTKTNNIPHRDD